MAKVIKHVVGWLLIGMGCWIILARAPVPLAAHASAETLILPVAQSLILEHTAAGTIVVDQALKVGNIPLSGDAAYYRGYLRFDLTRLPPGAQVKHAHLVFHVDRFDYSYPSAPAPGTALSCGVYTVTESWQPSATWMWEDNPAIVTSTTALTTILFEYTDVYTVNVTGIVQSWAAGQPNHGLLVGLYPDPDALAAFTAVLHGPAAISETVRPRLEITYHAPSFPWRVYMPLVLRNGDPRPDLTVEIVTPVDPDDPAAAQLRIANLGRSTASGFWIDLYLNPSAPPEVNQPWPTLCPLYGAAWQIPALASGESLTLTIGDSVYNFIYSQWPVSTYPTGVHTLWAYVDSWSDQPWGWVNETDETNNRAGPASFSVTTSAPETMPCKPSAFLPRPVGGR
ncbi:MAG: DNRLRE domain-containing protein [Anaerolineae bacterium]|nr:DNRLRE domain-containing protein [Anaerolineae bacterium]